MGIVVTFPHQSRLLTFRKTFRQVPPQICGHECLVEEEGGRGACFCPEIALVHAQATRTSKGFAWFVGQLVGQEWNVGLLVPLVIVPDGRTPNLQLENNAKIDVVATFSVVREFTLFILRSRSPSHDRRQLSV